MAPDVKATDKKKMILKNKSGEKVSQEQFPL
jgi:hypothetical protein